MPGNIVMDSAEGPTNHDPEHRQDSVAVNSPAPRSRPVSSVVAVSDRHAPACRKSYWLAETVLSPHQQGLDV